MLKDTRFNPYVGINLHHLRYTDGGGNRTSHQYNKPQQYEPWQNTFNNAIAGVLGLESKIYKGISLTIQVGMGIDFRRSEARHLIFEPSGFAQNEKSIARGGLLGMGLKIDINEFL